MKDIVAEQVQEAKKMEKRLAEGVELMEGTIVKGVTRMIAKLQEKDIGSCDWCEEVECNGYPECEFQKVQRVKECVICGMRTHPWKKCLSKGLRLGS